MEKVIIVYDKIHHTCTYLHYSSPATQIQTIHTEIITTNNKLTSSSPNGANHGDQLPTNICHVCLTRSTDYYFFFISVRFIAKRQWKGTVLGSLLKDNGNLHFSFSCFVVYFMGLWL